MYKIDFLCEIASHAAQIVNAEQLQHSVPRNMVCFRYIIVNTLHKGDNKNGGGDDDDERQQTVLEILQKNVF
jgi:stress response protein SCP2